jgi:D-lactate dehydrogenase (cytochrome)
MRILDLNADYFEYLKDESRSVGSADFICFPKTNEDIKNALGYAREHSLSVTLQGARTGLTAGAVPNSGLLINLSQMNKILSAEKTDDGNIYIKLEPGITLNELRKYIDSEHPGYFFPTDPTETTASLGGMINTNSSGALSYKHGSIRKFVQELYVLLSDGDSLHLIRNGNKSNGVFFEIETENNEMISGKFPSYTSVDIKNSAGYYSRYNMNLIDLFIGSEGTLGITTSITIKLIKKPKYRAAVTAFFESFESSLSFVSAVKQKELENIDAIEYFDINALNNLKSLMKTENAFQNIMKPPEVDSCAVYIEFSRDREEIIDDILLEISEDIEKFGGSEENTWMADSDIEIQKLKDFRHAIPESVNMRIDIMKRKNPRITKLGTDMAVKDENLHDIFRIYHSILKEQDLKYLIFGHIGNNHVHVNILPESTEDFEKGKQAYNKIAGAVIDIGGTVSAEHGIGKIKTSLLRIMYKEHGINEMKRIKNIFDRHNILNPGNLF